MPNKQTKFIRYTAYYIRSITNFKSIIYLLFVGIAYTCILVHIIIISLTTLITG